MNMVLLILFLTKCSGIIEAPSPPHYAIVLLFIDMNSLVCVGGCVFVLVCLCAPNLLTQIMDTAQHSLAADVMMLHTIVIRYSFGFPKKTQLSVMLVSEQIGYYFH